MAAELERAGRDRAGFSMRIGVPTGADALEQVAVQANEARRLGLDEFVVGVGIPTNGFEDHLQRWADALGLAGG
jgi:hypothetical protein